MKETNYLNCLTYGYLPLSYWKNWFRNIRQFFRNIKFAYQRITRGYCDRDVWDLDHYYSELFYQTINKLAEETYTYPAEYTFEGWQDYLREMAQHFKNSQEWNENEINNTIKEHFNNMIKFKESESEEYENAKNKWLKLEIEAAKYREDELNAGIDMLKKSFNNLWD